MGYVYPFRISHDGGPTSDDLVPTGICPVIRFARLERIHAAGIRRWKFFHVRLCVYAD